MSKKEKTVSKRPFPFFPFTQYYWATIKTLQKYIFIINSRKANESEFTQSSDCCRRPQVPLKKNEI